MIAAGLFACATPEPLTPTGPVDLRVDFIRRSVPDVLEGVVTAGTALESVELVELNNTTRLPGFPLGGNRPFSLSVSGLGEGDHPLVVRGRLNGELAELSIMFRVDRTRPGLASELPTKLTLGDSILLRFSEPLEIETVDRGLGVQGVDSWSWSVVDETSIRISLDWGFRRPTTVQLRLGPELKDKAGLGFVQVNQDIDFVDDADAGDFIAMDSAIYNSAVTTLQPRSAFLTCRGLMYENKVWHQLRFADGGVQTTDIQVAQRSSAVPNCTTLQSGADGEVFILHAGADALNVLSGTGSPASFKQVGLAIPFVARPLQPAAARLADGRVIATNGTQADLRFWLFDGTNWTPVASPQNSHRLVGIYSYRDSVIALIKSIDSRVVVVWVWRNESWVEFGSLPGTSGCCVSSNRLLCLTSDFSLVEVYERDAGVVGKASSQPRPLFSIADMLCSDGRATWALSDDVIEFREGSVTTWSLPIRTGPRLWGFPDGTTWVDYGSTMFRAAKH